MPSFDLLPSTLTKTWLGRQATHWPGLPIAPAAMQVLFGQGESMIRTVLPLISTIVSPRGPSTRTSRSAESG